MDDGAVGAVPLWKGGVETSWNVPKRGTGDNLEERVVHFLKIRFELALNVDDESGCDRGEQTGLFPTWGSHKDRGACGGKHSQRSTCCSNLHRIS